MATSARAQVSSPGTGITTSIVSAGGVGVVTVRPQHATISLAVETRAPNALSAATQNARISDRVLAALKNMSLGADRVSTSSYTIDEARNYQPGGVTNDGFIATNTVVVDVQEFTRVASVIDAGIAAGATRVSDVRFSSAATDSARRAALALAVRNARNDAEVMAASLGGRVGELIEVTSTGSMGNGYAMDAPPPAPPPPPGASTTIRAQDVTISASVLGRWQFLPRSGQLPD